MNQDLIKFINEIPKAELHIHLEGSIRPEMMFTLADRNNIKLKYKNIDELKNAYNFKDLRDFLTIYTQGTKVLKTAQDFYDITLDYLSRAFEQNVLHTEIFIDFQTYTKRNISSETIVEGTSQAIKEAEKRYNTSSYLILAFLRHLGGEAAMKTFVEALKYKDKIIGVGLASTEVGYPPELFEEVFAKAREEGFKTTAHAGEEGPAEYVRSSIEVLKVDRIDHGNKAMDDPDLIQTLIDKKVPLTLCPLSNLALGNVKNLQNHTLKKKLDLGMLVSVNSDDPSYFGGYVNENFIAISEALDLNKNEIRTLARNSFISSFLPEDKKKYYLDLVDKY